MKETVWIALQGVWYIGLEIETLKIFKSKEDAEAYIKQLEDSNNEDVYTFLEEKELN